jgi:hypothetical protein
MHTSSKSPLGPTSKLRRFSLLSLLILVTAIACGLGGLRIYRQRTISTIRELNSQGVGVIMVEDNSSWLGRITGDSFWKRRPRTAEIYVTRVSGNEYKLGSEVSEWPDTQKRLLALRDQLTSLGITDMQVWTYDSVQDANPFQSPPPGTNAHDWLTRMREEGMRKNQLLIFANENGFVCGSMDSQTQIDQRLTSLRP